MKYGKSISMCNPAVTSMKKGPKQDGGLKSSKTNVKVVGKTISLGKPPKTGYQF